MSILEQAGTQGSQMSASLLSGLNTLSENQVITFNLYKQLILPLDGFVFWVRADLLADVPPSPITIQVEGSLHYNSNQSQNEDETIAVQKVIFTTIQEVAPFNHVEATSMYLGCFENLEFSFTARTMYYKQSGLYHYYGDAVFPAMRSQIINDIAQLSDTSQVVSNSLPIWLAQDALMPIYPAYLVPTNLTPPYAVINILSNSQKALQSFPYLDSTSNHSQLIQETVKIVIYGLRNNVALDFQDYILSNSLNDEFGIMNMPIIRDEVRTQSELNVRGMKKSIEFEISYYQSVAQDIARQLILSSIPTYTFI
jgi:hypothetical protein